jgi:hypothetical protein
MAIHLDLTQLGHSDVDDQRCEREPGAVSTAALCNDL